MYEYSLKGLLNVSDVDNNMQNRDVPTFYHVLSNLIGWFLTNNYTR